MRGDGTVVPLVLNAGITSESRPDADREIARIYDQHAASVHRYLLLSGSVRADADEILQEAFLRLYRTVRAGDTVDNPKAWLIRVAQNLRTDKLRRDANMSLTGALNDDGVPPVWSRNTLTPEQLLLARERSQRLQSAMRELPERQYQYLLLRSEGLTLREIAQIHGVALQSVAEACARAIERLGKIAHE